MVTLDVGIVAPQKEKDGRMYYTFEFASKASNYIRHALAVVTVANGESLSDCREMWKLDSCQTLCTY